MGRPIHLASFASAARGIDCQEEDGKQENNFSHGCRLSWFDEPTSHGQVWGWSAGFHPRRPGARRSSCVGWQRKAPAERLFSGAPIRHNPRPYGIEMPSDERTVVGLSRSSKVVEHVTVLIAATGRVAGGMGAATPCERLARGERAAAPKNFRGPTYRRLRSQWPLPSAACLPATGFRRAPSVHWPRRGQSS